MELALEDEMDALEDAKNLHAEQRTPESRLAKRQAMASIAETRTWLRAKARLEEAQREVQEYAGATDPKKVAIRARAEADLERIPREFGPLLAAMEQLAAGAATASDQPLPDGSVQVSPQTIKARTRVGRGN
ncbi:hypothetical protein ACWENQ_08315 [Nonomuraea sp. NPDC004354]